MMQNATNRIDENNMTNVSLIIFSADLFGSVGDSFTLNIIKKSIMIKKMITVTIVKKLDGDVIFDNRFSLSIIFVF